MKDNKVKDASEVADGITKTSHASHHNEIHEPLIRIVKRDAMSWPRAILVRAVGLLLALIVAGVFIMLVTKLNPVKVYISMFDGAFGSSSRSWITVRDIMLLLCVAVGLAPAFKMRFWNIGAEGQILMGGLVTAACMMYFKSLPTYLLLAVMFLASMLAGALWGLLPAVCKSKWNTNETLFTLMMNYIAIQIVEFFVDFWDKKQSHSVGQINPDGKEGWLPTVFGMQYFWSIVIVVGITLVMFFYLRSSKQGYEISVVGESENTARYIGIDVKRVIIRTMLISGAICGIAGFIAVSGTSHTISKVTADGRGFTAIIVAWLGKFNAFIMALISFLLVFLDRGAVQIATDFRLNENASEIITGIILFFVLGSEFFIDYKIVIRGFGRGVIDKQKEAERQ